MASGHTRSVSRESRVCRLRFKEPMEFKILESLGGIYGPSREEWSPRLLFFSIYRLMHKGQHGGSKEAVPAMAIA